MKKLFFVALILCAVSFAQNNVARMLSGVNAQTGTSYTFVASDVTKIVTFDNANPVGATLPVGTTTGFGAGSVFTAVNLGAGTVTVSCSGCTINGAATVQIVQNQSVSLYGDGTNYISASGGGGGSSISGSTALGTQVGGNGAGGFSSNAKPAIDARDSGIDCTGLLDSTAALNTLFTSITGRQVNFPDVCQIRVTFSGGHGLVIQGQSSFVLHGNGHAVGTGGFVGPVIYGCDATASGPVLYINRSGYGRIEGIGITARGPSPCTTSTFTGSVQVDSTGNPGVTTHNIIFDNDGFTTSAQGTTTTNYKGLSVTDGGKQNGEMIRVRNSWIHCQNSLGSIGIDLENPTSDKDLFESNNVSSCFIGVKHANGNATIKDNLFSSVGNFSVFGSNGAAIYIGACSSGPINILNNEVDSSGDFINSGNDGVGLGCNSGLNIEGNFLGVSDPTPNNYVINIGNCCVQGYNLIGNGFLVTSNTSQYLVGSASQGLFGPIGYLYDFNNTLRSPTGSNSLGFSNFNFPFQSGEFHAPLSYSGNSISGTFGPNGTTPEFSSYSRVLFANSPHPSTQAQQSPFLAFRSWTGSIYDDWSFESESTGSGSQLALVHSKGTATNNWFVAEGKTSGITLGTIATPAAPTGINIIGGGGVTTYTYSLVDFGPNGNTLPSATATTTIGNTFASLSSSTYNQILFGFQFGTTRVCIRREVGGTTQGYIGCVPVAAGNQTYSTQDNANTYEFRDTGLAGDGSAAPVLNTTGVIDASLSPYIFLPFSPGYVATAQGNIGYDTTNKNWHVWQNAADRLMAVVNGSPVSGNCAKFILSGSILSVQDAGTTCGGSGAPGGSTLSFQFNNGGAFGGTTPAATVGVFIPERINPTAAATAPVEVQIGDCASPTTIVAAATTGTVAALDTVGCNIVHDRAASGAAVLTIPTPTTLANPEPIFAYTNNSAQTDTLTPTTFTIALGHTAAASTLSVPSNVSCKVQLDPVNASTWNADCHPVATSAGGSVNVNGSPVSSPNFNGTTPAAGAGFQNATLQASGSNVSIEVPLPTTPWMWLPSGTSTELGFGPAAQTGAVTNQVNCRVFVAQKSVTFTHISVNIATISAAQTMNLGIYDNSGNLIIDSGTFSTATATTLSNTVASTTLQSGTTYIECAAFSDTVAAISGVGNQAAWNNLENKNATRVFTCANALSAGALPATCGVQTPNAAGKSYYALIE